MEVLTLDGSAQDLQRMAAFFPVGAAYESLSRRAQRVTFNNSSVVGNATSIQLQGGMQMLVNDLRSRAPMSIAVQHQPTELEFAFYRGKGVRARGPEGEMLDFGGGEFRVGRVAKTTNFSWEAEDDAREQSVHFHLSPGALRELLGTDELPLRIRGLLEGSEDFELDSQRMDAQMFRVTDEIFGLVGEKTSASRALGAQLSLQGRALELIGTLCERLSEPEAELAVPAADVARVRRAREILVARLMDPPAVSELARLVGLGEGRLKNGFKALFGDPIMTHARRLRLEKARELLAARERNVTEVARLVGYANPSKFSAAYRRQFGVAPSAY